MASSPEPSEGASPHSYRDAIQVSRPLFTVPVHRPSDLSEADHILYLISDDKYRPMYRSALVESISDGNLSIILYTPQGIQCQVQQFQSFKSLHRVDYTAGSSTEAIKRAKDRLGECHYHGLFNNSHHFVSWAKTGLEYSLADLVHGVQGDYYCKGNRGGGAMGSGLRIKGWKNCVGVYFKTLSTTVTTHLPTHAS